MKSFYGLTQSVYDGTVLIRQETSSYTTAELREIVKRCLENQNNTLPDGWSVKYTEFDSVVYEHTSEVPVLNMKEQWPPKQRQLSSLSSDCGEITSTMTATSS